MAFPNGANDFTLDDLSRILLGEEDATPASNEEIDESQTGASTETTPEGKPEVTETKAFANRLKEATIKARNEERETIAKELGYQSYAEMQKAREAKHLEEKGLDPEQVSPIVEELVQKRLAEDPRFKELDTIREQRAKEWAEKELKELSDLTDGHIKSLKDVPKQVIDRWKETGSLKGAYMELEGENLVRSMRNSSNGAMSRGTTQHMSSPTGAPNNVHVETRPFNDKEKDLYRLFNPDVSDDELSKLTKPV